MCGFFKRNCLGFQEFLLLTQSPLVFAARSYGDLSSCHRELVLETWCGAGTPHSQNIPPEFLFTTCVCGTSPFCICAPPTSLDGCGFFNSVVTRLPFNSISDCSEWWLFYILLVILMWLCEEASRVYLRLPLDWNKAPFWKYEASNFSTSLSTLNIVCLFYYTHLSR